jgi:hypothetical protein
MHGISARELVWWKAFYEYEQQQREQHRQAR